jgi:hypothetical protein
MSEENKYYYIGNKKISLEELLNLVDNISNTVKTIDKLWELEMIDGYERDNIIQWFYNIQLKLVDILRET